MTDKNLSQHSEITEIVKARIETLSGADSWHVLDFIPFQPQGADFLEYERFLETGDYVKSFADRICFIALTLVAEYEAETICLTESEAFFETHPELEPNVNLRRLLYERLAEIIQDVIVHELSSVQIFFAKHDVLLSIDGALRVTLYNASGDFLHTVNLLAGRNGLFVKHHASDGQVTLL